MHADRPYVIVLGGPNGAGKTTVSHEVLAETFGVVEFVNADTIARGLSGFDPEGSAFEAGRIMLNRIRSLASRRVSFAFESTLSSRTFAPWLGGLRADGYDVHLIYIWLNSPELSIERVQQRVQEGGHGIPSPIIRRRHGRSAANLLALYLPLATSWRVFDNSGSKPKVVAYQITSEPPTIIDAIVWSNIHEAAAQAI